MMDGMVCVNCRRRPIDSEWRPFCSERCKLLDLQNWVDERYRVPDDTGQSLPDQSLFTGEEGADNGESTHGERRPSRK